MEVWSLIPSQYVNGSNDGRTPLRKTLCSGTCIKEKFEEELRVTWVRCGA